VQLGLSIADLEYLDEGDVLDMMIEAANDGHKYATLATQDDFDRF
jgi:hypothetical protein